MLNTDVSSETRQRLNTEDYVSLPQMVSKQNFPREAGTEESILDFLSEANTISDLQVIFPDEKWRNNPKVMRKAATIAGQAIRNTNPDFVKRLEKKGINLSDQQWFDLAVACKCTSEENIMRSDYSNLDKKVQAKALLIDLKPNFKVEEALLRADVHSSSKAFQAVVDIAPTPLHLQNLSRVALEEAITGLNEGGKKAMREIHAEGSDTRKMCLKHNVRASDVDFMVTEGLLPGSDEEKIKEVLTTARNQGGLISPSVIKMVGRNRLDGLADLLPKLEATPDYKKMVDDAREIVEQVKASAASGRNETSQQVKGALATVLERFRGTAPQFVEPTEESALNALKKLQQMVKDTDLTMPTGDNYQTAEELAEKIDGGSLGRGICLLGGCKHGSLKPRIQTLFARPGAVLLSSTAKETIENTEMFSDELTANSYIETTKSHGHSFASSAEGGGWGASFKAEFSDASAKLNGTSQCDMKKTNTCVIVKKLFMPIRELSIEPEDMRLTPVALKQLQDITSTGLAINFLSKYGDSYNLGQNTAGVMFFQKLTSTLNTKVSEDCAKLVATKALSYGASTSYSGCGIAAGVSFNAGSFNEDGTLNDKKQGSVTATSTMETIMFGPQVLDIDLFKQLALQNSRSWFIIDRGTRKTTCAMWELLLEIWRANPEMGPENMMREKIAHLRAATIEIARTADGRLDNGAFTSMSRILLAANPTTTIVPAGTAHATDNSFVLSREWMQEFIDSKLIKPIFQEYEVSAKLVTTVADDTVVEMLAHLFAEVHELKDNCGEPLLPYIFSSSVFNEYLLDPIRESLEKRRDAFDHSRAFFASLFRTSGEEVRDAIKTQLKLSSEESNDHTESHLEWMWPHDTVSRKTLYGQQMRCTSLALTKLPEKLDELATLAVEGLAVENLKADAEMYVQAVFVALVDITLKGKLGEELAAFNYSGYEGGTFFFQKEYNIVQLQVILQRLSRKIKDTFCRPEIAQEGTPVECRRCVLGSQLPPMAGTRAMFANAEVSIVARGTVSKVHEVVTVGTREQFFVDVVWDDICVDDSYRHDGTPLGETAEIIVSRGVTSDATRFLGPDDSDLEQVLYLPYDHVPVWMINKIIPPSDSISDQELPTGAGASQPALSMGLILDSSATFNPVNNLHSICMDIAYDQGRSDPLASLTWLAEPEEPAEEWKWEQQECPETPRLVVDDNLWEIVGNLGHEMIQGEEDAEAKVDFQEAEALDGYGTPFPSASSVMQTDAMYPERIGSTIDNTLARPAQQQVADLYDRVKLFGRMIEKNEPVPLAWAKPDGALLEHWPAIGFLQFTTSRNVKVSDDMLRDTNVPKIVFVSRSDDTRAALNKMLETNFACEAAEHLPTLVQMSVGLTKISPERAEPIVALLVRAPDLKILESTGIWTVASGVLVEQPRECPHLTYIEGLKLEGKLTCPIGSWDPATGNSKDVIKLLRSIFWPFVVMTIKSFEKAEMSQRVTFEHMIQLQQQQQQLAECYLKDVNMCLCNPLIGVRLDNLRRRFSLQACEREIVRLRRHIKQNEEKSGTTQNLTVLDQLNWKEEREKEATGLACSGSKEPVIEAVVRVLSHPDRDYRMLMMARIARLVNDQSEKDAIYLKSAWTDAKSEYVIAQSEAEQATKLASDEPDIASESYALEMIENRKDKQNKMNTASEAYAQHQCTLTHIFREMALIYKYYPGRFDYPALLARYVIDGGIVEYMDGDAADVNMDFVIDLMKEIRKQLRNILHQDDPRVMVMSVAGVQSSGKSTVLKTLFGVDFQVSDGQCTRGINLALVPTKRSNVDYNFVLVLDTEGVKSPMNLCGPDSEDHDNRLALFATLSADLCLCICDEVNMQEFTTLLPTVVSAMYRHVTGRRSELPMLHILVNKLHTPDKISTELEIQIECVKSALKTNEDMALETVEGFGLQFPRELSRLDLSRGRDIEFCGKNSDGYGKPNPKYGQQLAKMMDRIVQKLIKKRPTRPLGSSLDTFIAQIKDVSRCAEIADATGMLAYRSVRDRREHEELKTKLSELRLEADRVHRYVSRELETVIKDKAKAKKSFNKEDLKNMFDNNAKKRFKEPWPPGQVWVPVAITNLPEGYNDISNVVPSLRQELERKLSTSSSTIKIPEGGLPALLGAYQLKANDVISIKHPARPSITVHLSPETADLNERAKKLLFDGDESKPLSKHSNDEWEAWNRDIKDSTRRVYSQLLNIHYRYSFFNCEIEEVRQRLLKALTAEHEKEDKLDDEKSDKLFEDTFNNEMAVVLSNENKSESADYRIQEIYSDYLDSYTITATIKTESKSFIGRGIDFTWQKFCKYFGYDSPKDGKVPALDEVVAMAETAERFDEAAVRAIIAFTEEQVENYPIHVRTTLHNLVMERIRPIFVEVDKKWRDENSIHKALIQQREEFREYFKNRRNALMSIPSAVKQFKEHFLKPIINGGFETSLIRATGVSIEDQDWHKTSQNLRRNAHYLVLNIYENRCQDFETNSCLGRTDLALELLRSSELINETRVHLTWKAMLHERDVKQIWVKKDRPRIVEALKNAKKAYMEACKELRDPWQACLDTLLTNLPSPNYSSQSESSSQALILRDFVDDTKVTDKKDLDGVRVLTEIIEHVSQLDMPQINISRQKFFDKVRAVVTSSAPTMKKSCEARCPLCKMTCSKTFGHDLLETDKNSKEKLHECEHQPLGLGGAVWNTSKKLVAGTCWQGVHNDWVIADKGKFSGWGEDFFKDWERPPATGSSFALLERLFADNHRRLAEIFSCNPCDEEDAEFKKFMNGPTLQKIRTELEEAIGVKRI